MDRVLEPELMQDEEQVMAFHFADRPVSKDKFIECFDKFLGITKGTIVDIGCGTGNHLNTLKTKYPELSVIGYDGSQRMLDLAQKLYPSLEFNCKDIRDINLERCDAVICFFTLHHLHDPKVLIDLFQRINFKTRILVVDIVRPNTIEDAIRIRDNLGKNQNEVYVRDLFNSLCAALSEKEIDDLIAGTDFKKYILESEQYGKLAFILGNI